MTGSRSVASSVEVDTDPGTTFAIFTEEIGLWWLQGPINFYDSSRAYETRIEPGVGGRLVEVYDKETGDGKEVGRIVEWEPGVRLAWQSSVDDVHIAVRFDAIAGGTTVTVEATVPEGGADRGGSAWVRMTPLWFSRWHALRDDEPHEPIRLARLAIAVHYDQPASAARWLRDVFGFTPSANVPAGDTRDDHTWIEFHVRNSLVIVLQRVAGDGRPAAVTHTPWVFVDDLDAHFAHVKGKGATIVEEIWQHGARAYSASDVEGNHWTFAQASPVMRQTP